MDIDILLALFKVLGVLVSGLFGVLGAVFSLRDSNGELSRKGKVFIAGSICGLVLAIICQILESYLQREAQRAALEDTLASTRRLEAIAADLSRSLQPLESLEVYVSNFVSLEDESFQSYRLRLEEAIQLYLKKNRQEQMLDPNVSSTVVSQRDGSRIPLKVAIQSDSKLAPDNPELFPIIWGLFPLCYDFDFFKNPISDREISDQWGLVRGESDLNVSFFLPKNFTLGKDLEKGRYTVSGRLIAPDAEWNDSSGEIVSLPDLAGSQMIVSGCVKSQRVSNAFTSKEARLPNADTKMELEWINLKIGRRSLSIDGSNFRRLESSHKVYWVYDFPANQDELSKLFGKISKKAASNTN